MATSRSHLTALPPGFITVRILQLLFSTAILALSILVVVEIGDSSEFLTLISVALTLIILIWIVLATYVFPKAYNYWAVLAMEILLFLMWVDAFVWALSASFWTSPYENCPYSFNDTTQSYEPICTEIENTNLENIAGNAAIAVAALTACNMLLFLVSLIVVSVFIARHRDAGGHNKIGSAAPVFRDRNQEVSLMAQTDFELKRQNLELRQQYLALQQQNLDLQRNAGVVAPPVAAGQMGQMNMARGSGMGDPEMGYGQAYSPVSPPVRYASPHAQQSSPAPMEQNVLLGSGQHQEGVVAGKGKAREGPLVSGGAHEDVLSEHGDEIAEAPHVR